MRRLRSIACLVPVAVLVLGVPTPALAKGVPFDRGEVQGPGLSRPIVVPNRYPYLLNQELFQLLGGPEPDASAPSSPLGPRYRLTYHLTDGRRVLVDLYPYAEPRPVGFVAPGQVLHMPTEDGEELLQLRSGWYDYPPRLVEQLQDRGLPIPTGNSASWVAISVAAGLSSLLILLVRKLGKVGRAQPHPA